MPPENDKPAEESFKIIHPVHDHSEMTLPFIHALKLALASRGELEIVDLRQNTQNSPSVRAVLEKWGVLAPGSRRDDVIDLGLKITKVLRHGNEKKTLIKRMNKHFHDILVIGTNSHNDFLNVFSHDSLQHLSMTFRKTTLYVPSSCRPFVDPETGIVAIKKILMPVAQVPSSTMGFKLLKRLIATFPETRPEVVGLHCGQTFPFVSLSFLEGLSWAQRVVPESVVKAIVDTARSENADLIIMATKGRDTIVKKILGSNTEQVLRSSPCPVLSVPADE